MSEGLIWSILLAAVGILGIYLAGRKNLWGWALGVGAQVLWFVFAIVTQQYGFILSALAYGWVYGLNFWKWSAAKRGEMDDWGYTAADRKKYGLPYRPPNAGPKGGAGNSGASKR